MILDKVNKNSDYSWDEVKPKFERGIGNIFSEEPISEDSGNRLAIRKHSAECIQIVSLSFVYIRIDCGDVADLVMFD